MGVVEEKVVLQPNTVKACHMRYKNKVPHIYAKEYVWHIPKSLRSGNIRKGDVVFVRIKPKKIRVVVVDVFREEIEETGKIYKNVIGLCGWSVDLDNAVWHDK